MNANALRRRFEWHDSASGKVTANQVIFQMEGISNIFKYQIIFLIWSKSVAIFIKFKNPPRVPAFRTSSRASPSFPSSRLGFDLAVRATLKSLQHQNTNGWGIQLFSETPLVNSTWLRRILESFEEWRLFSLPREKWGTVWKYVSLNL